MTLRFSSFYTIFVLKYDVIFCSTVISDARDVPQPSDLYNKNETRIHNMFVSNMLPLENEI
jgi:hypothetical protein